MRGVPGASVRGDMGGCLAMACEGDVETTEL